MEISKKLKRIISLVLVWVMFTTCIPDSFISVVRAYAEDSTGGSQETDRKTITLNFTLQNENSSTDAEKTTTTEEETTTAEEGTTAEEETTTGTDDVQMLNGDGEKIIFTLYQITEQGLEKKISATYPDSVKDNTETQSDDSITAKIEKSSDADNKYTVTLTNISPDDSYVYTLQNQKTTDQTPVLLASKTLNTTVDAADITVNANNTDTVAVKGWVTQNVSNDPVSVTYTVFPVIKNGENNVILTDDVLYTDTINVGSDTDGTNPAFERTVTKNNDIKGYAVKFEGDDIKTKLVTANLTDDTRYTVGSENTPEELEAKTTLTADNINIEISKAEDKKSTEEQEYTPSYNDKIKIAVSLKGTDSILSEKEQNEVKNKLKVNLQYNSSTTNENETWENVEKNVASEYYTIDKTNKYRIEVSLDNSEYALLPSNVTKDFIPKLLQGSVPFANTVVYNMESGYTTEILAKEAEQDIDLKQYLDKNVTISEVNVTLNKLDDSAKGLSILPQNQLKVPAYYTGVIEVDYTVKRTGYEDAKAVLNINVGYGQLIDEMLSGNLNTDKIYSNVKGYQAEIKPADGYTLYVLEYSDENAPILSDTSKKFNVNVNDIIEFPENDLEKKEYRIYAIDEKNKAIYSKDITINVDTAISAAKIEVNPADKTYYGNRTVRITVDQDIDIESCLKSIVQAINVNDDITKPSAQEIKFNSKNKYIYSDDKNEYYTITLSSDLNNQKYVYEINFTGSAKYTIKKLSYTDQVGNESESVSLDEFIVDKIAPVATGFEWKAYNFNGVESSGTSSFSSNIERQSVYATYLRSMDEENKDKTTTFSLTGVEDSLSGIEEVFYCFSAEIINDNEVFEDVSWKKGSVSNNAITVTIDKDSRIEDNSYYIYYKLVDTAGNVSYYNGVGVELVWDNTAPKVSMTYHTDGSESSQEFTDETLLTGKDVKVGVKIEDANLYTKGITITKDGVKDTDTEVQIVWDENANNATITLKADLGKTHEYEVTVECADEAGNPASLTKTIIIDKTAPTVSMTYHTEGSESSQKFTDETLLTGKDVKVGVKIEDANLYTKGITIKKDGVKDTDTEAEIKWDGNKTTITLKAESGVTHEYEVTVKCADEAGNSASLTKTIIIDKTAPEGEIGIELKKNEKASEAAKKDALVGTEGSFKLSNITDKTAGIVSNESGAYIEYKLTNSSIEQKSLENVTDWDVENIESDNSVKIQVPDKDGQYYIYFKITDKAGNYCYKDATLVIDRTAPEITMNIPEAILTKGNNELVYNDTVEVKTNISESNISSKTIKIFKNGEIWEKDTDINELSKTITLEAVKNESTEYEIVIECEDKAGNPASLTKTIIIDKTAPVLKAVFDGKEKEGAAESEKYYKEATLTITASDDKSFNLTKFQSTIEDVIKKFTAKDKNDNLITGAITVNYPKDQDGKGQAVITFGQEANYTLVESISYTDDCGNIGKLDLTKIKNEFTIDNTLPTASSFSVSTFKNGKGEESKEWSPEKILSESIIENPYYSYTDQDGKYASYTLGGISDNLSGIQKVEYNITSTIYTDEEKIGTLKDWKDATADVKDNSLNIKLEKEGTNYIYYRLTDNAGNVRYYSGVGIVIDVTAPKITYTYVKENKTDNENKTYEEKKPKISEPKTFETNVAVKIQVEEVNLENTTVKVQKDNNAEVNYDNLTWKGVDDTSDTRTADLNFASTKEGERNQYTITTSVTDKAGNQQEHTEIVIIDRKSPEITLTADNNDNKKAPHYYDGERSIFVKIVEQDSLDKGAFREAIVKGISVKDITDSGITGTKQTDAKVTQAVSIVDKNNKVLYTISEWKEVDKKTGGYTVTFKADAMYTVDLSYSDLCGNTANVTAADDTRSFVIDSQAPVIEVTYNDNSENKVKDHYYKGNRKATVTVKDISLLYANTVENTGKEIKVSGITETVMATDIAGNEVKSPVQTGTWELDNSTKVFSKKITFQADAIYTFEVNGTDICENTSEYKDEKSDITYKAADGTSFVIDRQAPVIEVTYNDNSENKVKDHYYKGNREATVTVKDISLLYANTVENKGKEIKVSGITETVTATDIEGKEVTNPVQTGAWKLDTEKNVFIQKITFQADAIYTFGVSGTDICGNNLEEAADGTSFVIDRQAPVIEVTYNDNSENKVKDHYYKGNREATVTVKDISLLYANTVENTGKEIKVSGITETVMATDIAGNEVKSPVQTGNWKLDNSTKVFSKKITFQADAIYTFEVNGTDICENTSEYKDEKSDITYKAADGTSFVLDRQAPVIEVTYNDNSENKEKDHYYKGDRKATVTVKDLSCIYENTIQNVAVGADNTGITQVGYSITAKDEKDAAVSDNKSGWVSDGNWSYDSDKRQYTRDIIFTGNAIYTFEVSGTDICGNTSEYKDEKSDITYNAADGTSFVIDTQAPVVTVEYNDSSKLQDHYYSDTRTATISVKDLSYVYENWMEKQNDAAKSDVETVSKRMSIMLTAKDAAGNDIDAITESGWSFANGTYTYVITYGEADENKVDAIFTSAFSGNDIYNNDALISYKNSEGDVTDYESFVIDREAPVVTIAYNDSSKKQEHYYSDTRTASLTVYDLSYVYENELAKQADETKTDVDTVGNRMNIMLTAKDAAGNDIDAVTESGWSFANGTYRYVITYGEAGGNKVDAIFTSAFSGNDIYNRDALISYKNSEGDVTDYESFVIDREAPVVTIEYDDSNKLQDHYYSDTRTAAITVKDISYVYENQQAKQGKVTESDVYTVRNRMNITLTAKNVAGNDITAVTESGWNFADGAYHYVLTYGEAGGSKVDAIFTSTFSGTDIYGRRTSISYQDSEEKNVEDSASFVIDRKAPVITVTYTDTGKSKDHFYNADRTAVITVDDLSYAYEDQRRTAKDVLTPQERINLEITARDSLLNVLTGEKAQNESSWSFANGKYTKTITFANEAIYDFKVSGADIFEHTASDEDVKYSTEADNHSFVVDKTGPQVSLTYSDNDKTYYKGSRRAVLTLTDLSMVYNDRVLSSGTLYLNDAQADSAKGDSVKTSIYLRNDDTASDLNNAGNVYYTDSAWSLSGNVYTRTINYTGEAHYRFAVAGTDRCGNTADINYNGSSDAGEFWIDLTNPTAQISYDNNSQTREIGGRGYFRGLRTATIVITEGISTFDSSKVNISITAKDASGNPVEAHTTMSGWTTRQQRDTGSATTHTLTITYPGDANYDFGISYTDKAGNVMNTVDTGSSMSPYHFTVDTTSPSGSVTVSGLGTWNTLVSYRTFGLWSRTAVDIGAGYQDATSSVYSVEYYKTARTTAMTVSELNALGSSEWTAYSPFTIRPDDQFTIYLRIEDRSGNVTYVSSDGVILDITAPDVESIAPEITVTPVQQPVNGIYNTDVTVDIKVSDPITNGTYSGLRNVHYQVLNMGNVTQEGDLYNFSYTGGSPLQSQLVQQWTDQIIVDRNLNNSNDVQIVISAQDNSGNYASASNSVKIDVTQPQINITYDNNNGDTSFGEATYFKEDRTATIEITERNFNPDDVQITLTNADGAVPSITGWSSRSGLAANGDETVYTTTLTYSADGDYNFDITYADMAGNQNTATDYGSSLAPQVFTVDKTLPVINVSYDNNAATNGNYYSAARTATISITEHNFETGRFIITTTATDNGVSKTAPGISGWTSNGDIHTATVSFTDDAYYTIGMSYTDMAGNQAEAFTEQNFYVDKTMPYVTLQGIRNNSANNGETIGFILTCTDTNFDVFAPVLTVARLVDGQNKVETYSFDRTVSVANGIQYVIDNLPTDGIYSLVCTVYDKAGNAFNKIIYLDDNGQEVSEMNVTDASVSLLDFSVNRDGSAYKLDDATVAMLGSYYIREADENIVIYETNVDDLTDYVVELNGKVLEEGKDYTIEKSGGNGEWYIKKYIINRDLFEEEGEYKIVIHTKDSAENEAYSDIKGAELSFVVDKTAPEITVSGVENNGRYQVESQTVTVIPTDDGGKLETLDISVLDNNGNPVEGYPVSYEGSSLTDELDRNSGNITFAIPEGTGMSVVINCSDVAGNAMKELTYTNIVVSTSGLTIFLANKPLFYGTVGGVVAVVGGGSAVIILRRRKLSAGTKTQDDK